ncbi:MAG: hypothetical protein J7L55_05290 [Desulfurococcales archaeon]|nr:hypothetical protein [Desulfurococcales archaeon]
MKERVPEPLRVLKVIHEYGEVKGRVALHRLIYTLQTNKGINFGYRFINYSFGPYSKELEEDLKLLESLNLITEVRGADSVVIKATKKGMEVANSLGGDLKKWKVPI